MASAFLHVRRQADELLRTAPYWSSSSHILSVCDSERAAYLRLPRPVSRTVLTSQGSPAKQPPPAKVPAADVGQLESIMQNMSIRQDFVLAGE